MCGQRSGNYLRGGCKLLTGDLNALDIRRLAKQGVLAPGKVVSWAWTSDGVKTSDILIFAQDRSLFLDYSVKSRTEQPEKIMYEVRIEHTACNYGGGRPWFICPGNRCGRRVAILYGGKYFLCRSCQGLVYASTRENTEDRFLRKAHDIEEKLCRSSGKYSACGGKPPKMRWNTYLRLMKLHRLYYDKFLFGSVAKLGIKL